MIRRLLLLTSLLMATCSVQAASEALRKMYHFEQPVADAGAEARKQAIREAMATVLVRVTGNRTVLEQPQARSLIERAEGYVQRYGYAQRPPRLPLSDTAPLPSELAPQLWLTGQFVESALSADIRKSGLPLWSLQRPRLLLALVVGTAGQARLLDAVLAEDYPELQETAQARGLPLRLPQQESLLAVDAVSSRDESALLRAMQIHEADYLLWGRLEETDGKWLLQAELQSSPAQQGGLPAQSGLTQVPEEEPLLLEDLQQAARPDPILQSWRLRSREPGPLLREVMHRAGDIIASRHALAAVQPGGESVVGLWVRGLQSGEDYMRVQQHLERLPAIESLDLVAIREGVLVFRASSESSPEELDRSILQAGRLVSDPIPPTAAESPIWTGEFEFHYRLR